MTPAQAMQSSLERTYGFRIMEDPRVDKLADDGLAWARRLFTQGVRPPDLYRRTATILAELSWASVSKRPGDEHLQVQSDEGLERHWIPAAEALITRAKAIRLTTASDNMNTAKAERRAA